MKDIKRYLYNESKSDYIVGVILLPLLDRLFTTVLIFFYAYIISILMDGNLVKPILMVLIFGLVFVTIHFFNTYRSSVLEMKYTNDLKNDLVKKFVLMHENGIDKYNNGQLTEMFKKSHDIAKIPSLSVENHLIHIQIVVIVGSILYFLGIYVALVNIALILCYYLFQLSGKALAKERKKVLIAESDINEFFDDSLENVEVIKSYQKESIFKKRIQLLGKNLNRIKAKYGMVEILTKIASRYLNIAIMAVSIVATITLTPNEKKEFIVSASFFAAFLSQCLMELFENTKNKKNVLEIIKQYPIYTEQVDEQLETNKQQVSHPFSLKVENLSYTYDDSNVFSNVSVDFPETGMVAIIGESGSGKSTFLKCLSGLLSDFHGEIIINDTEVLESLYQVVSISYSNQEPLILEWSVKDNISMGTDYSFEKEENCWVEKLLDYLPTIETKVSPESLSGGQKQVIDILRGLNKKPQLFILDEPTSSQHTISGKIIGNLLKEYSKKALVIVSTHDQEIVKSADMIVDLGKNSSCCGKKVS